MLSSAESRRRSRAARRCGAGLRIVVSSLKFIGSAPRERCVAVTRVIVSVRVHAQLLSLSAVAGGADPETACGTCRTPAGRTSARRPGGGASPVLAVSRSFSTGLEVPCPPPRTPATSARSRLGRRLGRTHRALGTARESGGGLDELLRLRHQPARPRLRLVLDVLPGLALRLHQLCRVAIASSGSSSASRRSPPPPRDQPPLPSVSRASVHLASSVCGNSDPRVDSLPLLRDDHLFRTRRNRLQILRNGDAVAFVRVPVNRPGAVDDPRPSAAGDVAVGLCRCRVSAISPRPSTADARSDPA